MTAYRFVTITCDECGEVCDPGMARTIPEARRAARAEGWRTRGGLDLCPRHFGYQMIEGGWIREHGHD